MSRKEKYINYVVDDLVKKTRIDFEGGKIYFEFLGDSKLLQYSSHKYKLPPFDFLDFIQQTYGAKESEIHFIWDVYRGKIKKLIGDE